MGVVGGAGCSLPLFVLSSHRHICAIPHFATHRAIVVRMLSLQASRDMRVSLLVSAIPEEYERDRYSDTI